MTVSSAEPQTLIQYAAVAERIDTHLEGEARRLSYALHHFTSTCTEYRHIVDPHLATSLLLYSQRARPIDAWVRQVGIRFYEAGNGGKCWLPAIHDNDVAWKTSFDEVVNTAWKWLMSGATSPLTYLDLSGDISEKLLEEMEALVENRQVYKRKLHDIARELNKRHGRGFVQKADNLYSWLSHGLPRHAGTTTMLRNPTFRIGVRYVPYAGDLAIAGFDNWEKYGSKSKSKLVIGTIIDAGISIGISNFFSSAGMFAGGVITGGHPLGIVGGWFVGDTLGSILTDQITNTSLRDQSVEYVDAALRTVVNKISVLFPPAYEEIHGTTPLPNEC